MYDIIELLTAMHSAIIFFYLNFQNDTQTGALLDQYNALCPSACVAAQSALAAETSCRMDDDVAVICSGTCNTLVDAIMNACPLVRLSIATY